MNCEFKSIIFQVILFFDSVYLPVMPPEGIFFTEQISKYGNICVDFLQNKGIIVM